MLFKNELSNIAFDLVGKKDQYNKEDKKKITAKFFSFYTDLFLKKCSSINSFNFYSSALALYDDYLKESYETNTSIEERERLSIHKRVLQYIIEFGCDTKITRSTSIPEKKILQLFTDLFEIGNCMFLMASLKAEAIMSDSTFIATIKDDRLLLERPANFEKKLIDIKNNYDDDIINSILPDNYYNEFKNAIINSFDINIDLLYDFLQSNINPATKIGTLHPLQFDCFMSALANLNEEYSKTFLNGLILNQSNKTSIEDLVFKPFTLNRFMYRPFILWDIDGIKLLNFSMNSVKDSFNQLSKNIIPFGDAPIEWQSNSGFKKFVETKEHLHEKWLISAVTEKLENLKLFYDKNVKKLIPNKIHLNNELDIIVISTSLKTVYVCECKYFKGRFDTPNQLNDFNNLTIKYFEKLETKIKIVKDKIKGIEEHFKTKNTRFNYCIKSFSIVGLFILNTPTFYQYLETPFKIISLSEVDNFFSDCLN